MVIDNLLNKKIVCIYIAYEYVLRKDPLMCFIGFIGEIKQNWNFMVNGKMFKTEISFYL